jgi:hypothetical protein
MDKYRVNWIVFDENVVSYLNPQEFISMQKQENYLDHSDKYRLVKILKSSDPKVRVIKIYAVNLKGLNDGSQKTVVHQNSLANVGPAYNYTNYDKAYQEYGTYITNPNEPHTVHYPFRELFSGRKAEELNTDIEENQSSIIFKAAIPPDFKNSTLRITAADSNFDPEKPEVKIVNNSLIVSIPKDINTIYQSSKDPNFLHPKANNCQDSYSSKNLTQNSLQGGILSFASENAQNCHSILLPQLEERFSYLVNADAKHVSGRQLELSIVNSEAKTSTVDILLPDEKNFSTNHLIVPPMQYYGLGYNLTLNNISIGNTQTVNDVKNVEVYKIPFYFLTNLEMVNSQKTNLGNDTFIFYQSYDSSWKAYELKNNNWLGRTFPFIFGKKLKDHFLVNNWANGWTISSNTNPSNIVTVFMPQYLENLGLAMLLITILAPVLAVLASKKPWKKAPRVDL